MRSADHPMLYEIQARDWLGRLGRAATFDDVPDDELDRIAGLGFDWIWLLGVWQTGALGRDISRGNPDWVRGYRGVLADLRDEDIAGSPFAIQAYTAHVDFGGDDALARLRVRLARRGVRLMLDFVPNHTAPDHPWVDRHPEFYIEGTEADMAREPENFGRVATATGPRVLAFGRDPYFPGWNDTLQLNYRHPGLKGAMMAELASIAARSDGVRCDMAMLLLPDIFAKTWGEAARPSDGADPDDSPFWPAAIARARAVSSGFVLLAEAYWDLEWTLQQQGFDFTYDKRLYDRLLSRDAVAVRGHLHADIAYQVRSARFLENHDEPRAASAFPPIVHRAAAVVTFLVPGLRFFHEGQLEGRTIRPSVHLGRRPDEPDDPALRAFYRRLLEVLRRPEVRRGRWEWRDSRPAWEGNPTSGAFLTFEWSGVDAARVFVVVNFGPTRGQCFAPLAPDDRWGRVASFRDLLGDSSFDRPADDLATRGLYLDLPAWGTHAFAIGPGPPLEG